MPERQSVSSSTSKNFFPVPPRLTPGIAGGNLAFLAVDDPVPHHQHLWGCLTEQACIEQSTSPSGYLALDIVAITRGSFKWFAIRAQATPVLETVGWPTLYPSKAPLVDMRLIDGKTNQTGSPTT
ncbi:unnamed protein product [Phytophthora fragariaefolia]|uniref:Unnamed protein product n=1 Tax=Phytophthora fragariaefolia TaxID=1490495 RepID=A0A9W6UFN6_9STRA|nr:unnamed protein product [Phytophthora fragariaefolia]